MHLPETKQTRCLFSPLKSHSHRAVVYIVSTRVTPRVFPSPTHYTQAAEIDRRARAENRSDRGSLARAGVAESSLAARLIPARGERRKKLGSFKEPAWDKANRAFSRCWGWVLELGTRMMNFSGGYCGGEEVEGSDLSSLRFVLWRCRIWLWRVFARVQFRYESISVVFVSDSF